ncbi:MAG TPA: hypothetical protein VF772_14320, partial [Terriglobales bacterium]
IGMPLLNGLDAAERLKSLLPNVKFVFLTIKDDSNLAEAALNLGRWIRPHNSRYIRKVLKEGARKRRRHETGF